MFSQLKQIKNINRKSHEVEKALSQETVEGSAAWGKVKVVVNLNMKITEIKHDPSLNQEADKLVTHIKEAANDALDKARRLASERSMKLSGIDPKDLMKMLGQG